MDAAFGHREDCRLPCPIWRSVSWGWRLYGDKGADSHQSKCDLENISLQGEIDEAGPQPFGVALTLLQECIVVVVTIDRQARHGERLKAEEVLRKTLRASIVDRCE